MTGGLLGSHGSLFSLILLLYIFLKKASGFSQVVGHAHEICHILQDLLLLMPQIEGPLSDHTSAQSPYPSEMIHQELVRMRPELNRRPMDHWPRHGIPFRLE